MKEDKHRALDQKAPHRGTGSRATVSNPASAHHTDLSSGPVHFIQAATPPGSAPGKRTTNWRSRTRLPIVDNPRTARGGTRPQGTSRTAELRQKNATKVVVPLDHSELEGSPVDFWLQPAHTISHVPEIFGCGGTTCACLERRFGVSRWPRATTKLQRPKFLNVHTGFYWSLDLRTVG